MNGRAHALHADGSRKLCMEEVRRAMNPRVHAGADLYTSMAALRAELSAMTLAGLLERAGAACVSEEALAGAEKVQFTGLTQNSQVDPEV